VKLAPWEYLFVPFNSANFPDIFHPTWIASLVLLVILIVLYNVRTRALHRHAPYLEMWEWLWWTGLITFSMVIIESLFVFDYILVLATQVIGLAALVWIRFARFPPFLAAYEQRLARERYFTKQKHADPEATIRKRGGRPQPPRQRQRRRRR
jgi:hypothetical protein